MTIRSRTVVLPVDNIDTDQIIPARFLKTISKEGLGKQLFHDWRYSGDGTPNPSFPLNQAESRDCRILVAGDNFGCGSSREHAPWALTQYGFQVVISTSFADIFRQNALKNGLLPVVTPGEIHAELLRGSAEVTVDLEPQTLTLADGRRVSFEIDAFAKFCLLNGVDEVGYLLAREGAIRAYEDSHPGAVDTRGGEGV